MSSKKVLSKLKGLVRKHWKLFLLFGIFFVLIIPFIINLLFKFDIGIKYAQAEWSADGLLGYLGTLIGASATIISVILTIRFTDKQQKEDRIIAAKPWLTSTTSLLCFKEEIQDEENGQTLFVSLNSEDLFAVSKHIPFRVNKDTYEFNKADCAIRYVLKNVGGNTATNISITLNNYPLIPNFALESTGTRVFVFVLPLKAHEKETYYELCFSYGDIVSDTRYEQKETLIIQKDTPGNGVTFAQKPENLLTGPTEREM